MRAHKSRVQFCSTAALLGMRITHALQIVILWVELISILSASSTAGEAATTTTLTVSRQVVLEVLSSFKQGISSDPLSALVSWDTSNLSSNPCSSSTNWTGILCSSLSPHDPDLITNLSINLHSQSLKGYLTSDLSRLPILTSLDFSSNLLSGNITFLSKFSNFQNLQYLSLAQNSFHGPFSLPSSCFPNLLYLSVAENSLSGPLPSDQLSRCPALQVLNVSNNQFVGSFFPSGLGNLTSTLYNLDAGVNSLSGRIPESIGNCSLLTFLSIPGNNFSGQIPSSIGLGCPNLKFFSLFQNNLSGNIPKEMGLLSKLTYLSIGLNNFSGEIFNILANCSALSTLDISQMYITGHMPDDLGLKLSNLRFLNLEFNLLTGTIPQSLGNCSRLDYLLMGFNYNISGAMPQALFQAQFISQLDLQHNSLSGIIPYQIGNLTLLQKAYLNNNQFTGSLPEEMGMLASIQVLTLEHNSLSGNFPNQLFNCTSFMGLSLHDNNFIGPVSSSIGFLRSLASFDAFNNNIIGTLPSGLSNCTSLESISLSNNMLSGEIPNSVITGLAKCVYFNLAHNNITGPIPNTEFQQMIFLQTLDLSYNQLSGFIPSGLSGCVDLHSLNLSHNKLVGSIPPAFGGTLLSLTDLDLSDNTINGSIPQEFGNLQSLQQLDLSDNDLSGTIPSALAELKGLQFLNLSYNIRLQGMVPQGGVFSNLTQTSFLGDPMLCGGAVNKTCMISTGSDNRFTKWKIVIIILVSFVFLAILGSILMLLSRKRERKREQPGASWDFDPYLRLTMDEIQQATKNYSVDNVLGVGVTGTVYKGIMKDGTFLAFKRFNLDNSSIHSFLVELQSIGPIRHRHLIRILGYVSNQLDTNILILEYMPNGSLYDHLHGHEERLSWKARLQVAVGVAEGLDYLHNDCPAPVIHCDLKPQNILLDENMEVRITDFGLAKVLVAGRGTASFTDNMKGTFGYMAPELASYGHISRKCDVYSYGILLMELITGCKPSEEVQQVSDEEDKGSTMTLVQWVVSKFEADEIRDIVDKQMQESLLYPENQVKELLNLAVKCTDENPRNRPTMRQVVQALPSAATSSVPLKPAFSASEQIQYGGAMA